MDSYAFESSNMPMFVVGDPCSESRHLFHISNIVNRAKIEVVCLRNWVFGRLRKLVKIVKVVVCHPQLTHGPLTSLNGNISSVRHRPIS